MLESELQVGKCYLKSYSGSSIVRKVLSINGNKVRYKPLFGPSVGKYYGHGNTCSIRTFLRNIVGEIEEVDDYSYLHGFKAKKNYTLLKVNGDILMTSTQKRVNFYLKKGLLKWVDDNTLIFTTDEVEKKMLEYHKGKIPQYFIVDKKRECAVCGVDKGLTRHHVVPKKDLSYYPEHIKKDMSNRLAICRKCHSEYEIKKETENTNFNEYNSESAIKWMNHFIETMKPKHLPHGWHVLNEYMLK